MECSANITSVVNNVRFSGSCKICAVVGCSNSTRKLFFWRETQCNVHLGLLHKECPCLVPFSLHVFPKNQELRREWVAAINRKEFTPGKHSRVCSLHFLEGRLTSENSVPQLNLGCSLHFLEGRLTSENSVPQLNLGYSKKVVPGRRPQKRLQLQKQVLTDTSNFIEDGSFHNECTLSSSSKSTSTGSQTILLSFCDAATQWEDPSLSDHIYADSHKRQEATFREGSNNDTQNCKSTN